MGLTADQLDAIVQQHADLRKRAEKAEALLERAIKTGEDWRGEAERLGKLVLELEPVRYDDAMRAALAERDELRNKLDGITVALEASGYTALLAERDEAVAALTTEQRRHAAHERMRDGAEDEATRLRKLLLRVYAAWNAPTMAPEQLHALETALRAVVNGEAEER